MRAKILKTSNSIAILLLLLLCSFAVVHAATDTTTEIIGDLVLRRTIPDQVYLGQKFWVLIEIQNEGSQQANIRLMEKLGEAQFDESQAQFIEVYDPGPAGQLPGESEEGFKIWYYTWQIELPPNESATIAYWLIPESLGTYVISPSEITLDGETHHTNSADVLIVCKMDDTCDLSKGENYLTCPEDCSTGLSDGICDGVGDGIVDADCEQGYDPDSEQAITAAPTKTPAPSQFGGEIAGFPVLFMIAAAVLLLISITLFLLAIRGRKRT